MGCCRRGKSHLMRVAATLWCLKRYQDCRSICSAAFAKISDQEPRKARKARATLAGFLCGSVRIVDDEIRFGTGSKIYLCHRKDEKDIYKYQGAEIHVLLIDELHALHRKHVSLSPLPAFARWV